MYEEKTETITIRISKYEKKLITRALENYNKNKIFNRTNQSEFLREIITKGCIKINNENVNDNGH